MSTGAKVAFSALAGQVVLEGETFGSAFVETDGTSPLIFATMYNADFGKGGTYEGVTVFCEAVQYGNKNGIHISLFAPNPGPTPVLKLNLMQPDATVYEPPIKYAPNPK